MLMSLVNVSLSCRTAAGSNSDWIVVRALDATRRLREYTILSADLQMPA